MKGRKKKPTQIKKVQGTYRKDRAPANEPKPSDTLPEAPAWLSSVAKRYFEIVAGRLIEMGLATASHTEMLVELSIRLAEVEECSRIIEDEGRIYTTQNRDGAIMKRAHPAVALRNEALRHAQSLLAEFGLSPASMAKVSIMKAPKALNPFAQLTK